MMNDPYEEIEVPSIPHSREAEEAVVGAVLINPDCFHDLHFLKADHFYIHRHKWIWDAFTRLSERHTPIDYLTVSDELDKTGQLMELGGPAYLTTLTNQVPSSWNAESYARIVEANALRRRMIAAANAIASSAYNEEVTALELQETAAKAVYDAVEVTTGDGETLADAVSRVYNKTGANAELRKQGAPLELGLMTGYIDLDKILQGIEGGELVTVAGRPGMGKTALMDNIARNCAMAGKRVAYFSMEMTNDEKARRLLAIESKIDSQRIKSGAIDDSEWSMLTHSAGLSWMNHVFLDDTSMLTPMQLRSKCLRRANRYGLDLVIIDYMQLMGTGSRHENRTQEVSYLSRQCKTLAQELKIPVFAASQLSRAVEKRENKRPILSDLRESGSIEQDSNIVIFLYRPDQYESDTTKQNVVEINVAKRRDGPTGSVELIYRPTLTKFCNAVTKHFRAEDVV